MCDPRAALFCFAIALVAYNAVSIVHATIAIEHSREDAARMSHFAMSREILETTDGLLVALPAARWSKIATMPLREFVAELRTILPQPLLEDVSKIRSRPQEATPSKDSRQTPRPPLHRKTPGETQNDLILKALVIGLPSLRCRPWTVA